METGLKNKVILIAGGSYGIGFATALRLAEENAKVAILSRDEDRLRVAAEKIKEKTGNMPFTFSGDVTKLDHCQAFIKAGCDHFGPMNGLVVATGSGHRGSLSDAGDREWEQNWALNMMAPVYLVRESISYLKKNRNSKIVIVGSASSKQPTNHQLVSNVTKAGILTFVKTLAAELAEDNICINNVCPGRILSERRKERMIKQAEEAGLTLDEYIHEVAQTIPLKRLGDPSEVAAFIVFLLSEHANYITGQSINVDGGLVKSIL